MVRQARTLRMLQLGTAAGADQQDQQTEQGQDVTKQPAVVMSTTATSGQQSQPGQVQSTIGVKGLRHETRVAADSFVAFLREPDTASMNQDDQPGLERTVRAHSAFVQTVATLCATKMRNENMSAKSVCQAVGVMSAMWMLSPAMRRVTRMQSEDIKAELSRRLDDRARTELDRTGGDTTSLSRRWRRRIEAIESAKPAQRESFTAASAALTMIGLSENAAAKLRAAGPATDQEAQAVWDAIEAEHQAVVDKVYGLALGDGVEPREVDELVRITLAQHIERDPDRAADFASLAYGKEVSGFHDANALPVPAKVLLRPRGPLSPDQHRERLAGLVHQDLGRAFEQGNAGAFFDRLREHLGDDDRSAGDAALRADGLQAPLLRSIACREVVESLGEQHPQFQKSMSQIYGRAWSQAIVEDLCSNADLTSAASSLSHSMAWDHSPVDARPEPGSAESDVADVMEYEPSL